MKTTEQKDHTCRRLQGCEGEGGVFVCVRATTKTCSGGVINHAEVFIEVAKKG